MRFLPTKIHAILDYLVATIMMMMPWFGKFAYGGTETYVIVIAGVMATLSSLATDYELGIFRKISMRTHLWLDFAFGVLLIVSPWLFMFHERTVLPYLVFGIYQVMASLITKQEATTAPPIRIEPDRVKGD